MEELSQTVRTAMLQELVVLTEAARGGARVPLPADLSRSDMPASYAATHPVEEEKERGPAVA